METVMSYIFLGLVHLLVLASVVGMIYFLFYVITLNPTPVERLLRVAAFAAGLLIYVGAKALGITIPKLMASAIAVTNPATVGFFGVLVPGLSGTIVAWFCLRLMRQDTDVAARGLVLFATFVFTMFADSYAMMAREATTAAMALVLPNITFVIGVILYTIFKYKPDKPGTTSGQVPQTKNWAESIRKLGQGVQEFKAEGLKLKEGLTGTGSSAEKRPEPVEQPEGKDAQEDHQEKREGSVGTK
jgi:hypothetical protein